MLDKLSVQDHLNPLVETLPFCKVLDDTYGQQYSYKNTPIFCILHV